MIIKCNGKSDFLTATNIIDAMRNSGADVKINVKITDECCRVTNHENSITALLDVYNKYLGEKLDLDFNINVSCEDGVFTYLFCFNNSGFWFKNE